MATPHWVGTWGAAPQLTEPENDPPSPGLTGNTLRQVAYVSIGGDLLRVRFSNAYGNAPLTMNAVHLARSTGGNAIDAATDRQLRFGGMPSATVAAGTTLISDPIDLALPAQSQLAVTIAFGTTPSAITGHPGSRTNSYLQAGNAVAAASLTSAVGVEHWYVLTGIDVMADAATAAVVALGDSLTDGRGTTTDGNDRWPDALARRLRASAPTSNVAVLNMGMGANKVVSGGKGPTAMQRFGSDVLGQSGVRWLIMCEGVNDIGEAGDGTEVANDLIAAYGRLIDMARTRGIRVYGAPITPFGKFASYYSAEREAARQMVNGWIRTSGRFDAVIDFDAAVRDPANPVDVLAAYDSGDGLHLNPAGYKRLADVIDLALFERSS